MIEHQADATEQALVVPLLHLLQHLIVVGTNLLGELVVGPWHDGQAALQALAQIEHLLTILPTGDVARQAWADFGEVIVCDSYEEMAEVANGIASEHVQILTEAPRQALEKMHNYGALFLGEGTCVSYGDKVIGTNHVLPTRGAARYTGGLWVGKYLKTVTYQEVTDQASSVSLGELCGRAARVESFEGHARSGDVRVAKYTGAPMSWSSHSFGA